MPDAPPPVYNSLGDIVGSWQASLSYDEVLDVIVLNVHTPGGPWRKEGRYRVTFPPDAVEEAIEAIQRVVRTAGARRLF